MKISKPLSKLSKAELRQIKADLIRWVEDGNPKNYEVYISSKQLAPAEYGELDTANKEIILSPTKGTLLDFISTFVHEVLHYLLPHAKHAHIYRFEQAILKECSNFDKERLLNAIVARCTWDD